MLIPAVIPYVSHAYPLGNTPAVSLTRGLPQGSDADILLLGCGDVRNILYTAYTERGFPLRKLDITCCDVEPSTLARNILLFTLLIDGIGADEAWDLYFHFYIGNASRKIAKDQAAKLLGLSRSLGSWNQGAYGAVLQVCDVGSLDLVKEVWSKYAAPDSELCTGARFTEHLKRAQGFQKRVHGGTDSAAVMTGLRSAAPLSLASREVITQIYSHFWKYGTFSEQPPRIPNPLFSETPSENICIHYGTDPLLGFHLATAFARLAPSSPLNPGSGKDGIWRVVDAAKLQFRQWASAFQGIAKGQLCLRFAVADALSFSHVLQCSSTKGRNAAGLYRRQLDSSPLILDAEAYEGENAAPTSFDVIDTSNLADHIGSLNILVATASLLKDSAKSTLYMETLLKSAKTRKEQFSDLLRGHAPTISLLLGLSPVDYWTNATSISCVDELLMNAVFSREQRQQVHSRLAWKLTKHFPQQKPDSSILTADAHSFAHMVFQIYGQMFEHEDGGNLLNISRDEIIQKLNNAVYPVYHRGSFAALMKRTQANVSTDWSVFWEELVRLVRADGTALASLRGQFFQELGVQLYLQGVYSEKWIEDEVRPNLSMGCFNSWENIPKVMCVTVVVPRRSIEKLYSTDQSKISAPTFNMILMSPNGENYFSSVQVAFGDVEKSGDDSSDDFSLSIRPDHRRWQGMSPMVASFYVPTNALLVAKPGDIQVGIGVKHTIASVANFRHLQPSLAIYLTTLDNRRTVFFSKYMPGMPGYPMIGSRDGAETGKINDRATSYPGKNQTKNNHGDASKTIISVHFESGKIQTLCGHVDFLSAQAQLLLTEKTPIELRQSSLSSIDIVFGKDTLIFPVYFPVPVLKDGAKTRIARKSSYIEVIAPLTDPVASESLASFLYPIAVDEQSLPVVYNGNHVNLDSLPILSVDDTDRKDNKWLVTLVSHHFSLRERRLRELGQPSEGISASLRLNFKESLFTMFMLSAGLQGGSTGLFALSHPTGGNQIIIFVRAIRIDGAAGSVVADAAVLPLTQNLVASGEIGEFLLVLRELQFCVININDEELVLWKKVLPAFAERCRTWSHRPDCEYKKPGATVPLSEKPGQQFMCTCSNNKLPDQFMNIPEWNQASKHMVRVAISPTFAVPFMEDILDPQLLELQGGLENLRLDKCRNCNATEGKNGKKLLKCAKCKDAMYCSAECQKKDWKKHRMECSS